MVLEMASNLSVPSVWVVIEEDPAEIEGKGRTAGEQV